MDVSGAGNADGANVQVWSDSSNAAQRWKLLDQGNGSYELEPECAPGRRLDVNGSGTTDGTNVHIWIDNNTNAQRWHLIKPPRPREASSGSDETGGGPRRLPRSADRRSPRAVAMRKRRSSADIADTFPAPGPSPVTQERFESSVGNPSRGKGRHQPIW